MITNHGWFPVEYLDETSPTSRPNPTHWIVRLKDGRPALDAAEDAEHRDGPEDESGMRPLEHGEVVAFCTFQHFGYADLTVNPDGTYECGVDMPAGTDTVRIIDTGEDHIYGAIREAAEGWWDIEHPFDQPEHIEIEFYAFPERDFRFDAEAWAFSLVKAPTHRHRKRGTSYVLERQGIEVQTGRPIVEGDTITVYVGADGKPWARLDDEFNDGRFEPLGEPT